MFAQLLLILSIVMLGSPKEINILDMLTIKITDFEKENYRRFEDEFYSYYNTSDVKEIRKMHARRLLSFMNKSVDPCEDFYEFSCGNFAQYVDGTNLDGDASFGDVFNIRALQNILDEGIEDENAANIREFYEFCRDYGLSPRKVGGTISGFYNQIRKFNWLKALSFLSNWKLNILFSANDQYEIDINVGGNQSEFDSHSEFMEYATKVLVEEFGLRKSSWLVKGIGGVYEFERNLKEVMYSLDPETSETYDKEYLAEVFPTVNFNVRMYYDFAKWKDLTDFMQNTSRHTILRYYIWELYKRASQAAAQWNELTSSEKNFTCASIAVELMPDQTGYVFTKKFLNPDVVEDVSEMTENIREQLRMMFQQNSWFDRATRNEAVAKLDNIEIVYGLPEFVLDGSIKSQRERLNYDHQSILSAIVTLQFHQQRMKSIQRSNEARDVKRWGMRNTLAVNAGYSQAGIMFIDMGMLVPPIYHVHLPHFFKYGNLGATIGHEFMHGFDTNGVKFNSEFEKSDLFTPRMKAKFIRSAECIYTLYNKKYNADGLLTISENIPDIVGLDMGYKAYKKWAETVEDVDAIELDGYEDLGLTKDQLFFLSQSLFSCSLNPNLQEADDPHAPPKIRINAAADNSKDFARAFNCPVNSERIFQDKCHYLS